MNKSVKKCRDSDDDNFIGSRRGFLKAVAGVSLLTLSGTSVLSAAGKGTLSYKNLSLKHAHTGDELKLTYFEQGHYIEDALQEINFLLRDYHTGEAHPIDPSLLDQLYDLKLTLGTDKSFLIFSGYRSPRTNARLSKRYRNVAKHSLHIQGRALDLRVDGLATHEIRNVALAMRRGGVGYSQRSDFVHLDTGSFRSWLVKS